MEALLRKYRGYLLLTLIFTAVLGVVLLWRQPAPAPIALVEPTPLPTATPGHIMVYVSGAVRHPEVYRLPENSRVKDALVAAGGLRVEAATDGLNLAALLHDGQHLRVPAQGEEASLRTEGMTEPAQGGVDINSATAADLEALPGIGAVIAERIVADRQTNGPFTSVEDLQRVKGVGPALLQKLEGLIVCR